MFESTWSYKKFLYHHPNFIKMTMQGFYNLVHDLIFHYYSKNKSELFSFFSIIYNLTMTLKSLPGVFSGKCKQTNRETWSRISPLQHFVSENNDWDTYTPWQLTAQTKKIKSNTLTRCWDNHYICEQKKHHRVVLLVFCGLNSEVTCFCHLQGCETLGNIFQQ